MHYSNADLAASRETIVRSLGLLVPLLVTAALWLRKPPGRRQIGGAVLGFLWSLPALLAVHRLAGYFGWWNLRATVAVFAGMPVDLYLGWAILWGPLAAILLGTTRLTLSVAMCVSFDLLIMPLCPPVVVLGRSWIAGELVAVMLILIPAQLLFRWTRDDSYLGARAILQVILFAGLIGGVLPLLVAEATGTSFASPAIHRPLVNITLQLLGITALLALSAVQEFAERGAGTPFPLDPPRRLVTTGLYRYVRNPMQSATVILIAGAAILLRSPWLFAAGLLMVAFSVGFAAWSEEGDLRDRFDEEWLTYRRAVRRWLPRWRPYSCPAAVVYVAQSCGACRPVGSWIQRLQPAGLEVAAAEGHPERDLTRMSYETIGAHRAVEEGIGALARSIEHVNFAWAVVGSLMRLPLLRNFLQVVVDAVGGEERLIRRTTPMECKRIP